MENNDPLYTSVCSHGVLWGQSCGLCGRYITAPSTYQYTYSTIATLDEESRQLLREIRDLLKDIKIWAEKTSIG